MYDPRLSDEENNLDFQRRQDYREWYRSEGGYSQRCRDNRTTMRRMWKVLLCLSLGCIAFGFSIGAAPGGFVLAAFPLLFGLFISFLVAVFPEDWTGIF